MPQERTWRTETSKYPEEKKATAIPEVAASETGQTHRLVNRLKDEPQKVPVL